MNSGRIREFIVRNFRSKWILFLFALIIRVLFAWVYGHGADDLGEYSIVVDNYLNGLGFVDTTARGPINIFYCRLPPLYPLVLLCYRIVFGGSLFGLRVLFSVVGAANCVLAQKFGENLKGEVSRGWPGWILCFYPGHILWSTRLLPESLVMLAVTGALYFLIDGLKKSAKFPFIASGVCWGVAALGRSEFLLFPVFLTIWILWKRTHHWKRALLIVVAYLLLLAPWTVRNSLRLGELTLTTSGRGEAFYTAHSSDYVFGGISAEFPSDERWEGVKNENDLADRLIRIGMEYIIKHPGLFVATTIGNILVFCRPFLTLDPRYVPWVQNAVYTLTAFPLLVFFLKGMESILRSKENIEGRLLLWLVFYKLLMAIPFVVVVRFREVLAPVLIIVATEGFEAWRSERNLSRVFVNKSF